MRDPATDPIMGDCVTDGTHALIVHHVTGEQVYYAIGSGDEVDGHCRTTRENFAAGARQPGVFVVPEHAWWEPQEKSDSALDNGLRLC